MGGRPARPEVVAAAPDERAAYRKTGCGVDGLLGEVRLALALNGKTVVGGAGERWLRQRWWVLSTNSDCNQNGCIS